ncbi:hypothetical protein AAIR98_001766 [Elusimicrobium simillimum]|uniref:hypothetical protein n=1 Tax=Elusimicrobium simillimum TaxID=3143438 RepID=UPI003C6F3FC0
MDMAPVLDNAAVKEAAQEEVQAAEVKAEENIVDSFGSADMPELGKEIEPEAVDIVNPQDAIAPLNETPDLATKEELNLEEIVPVQEAEPDTLQPHETPAPLPDFKPEEPVIEPIKLEPIELEEIHDTLNLTKTFTQPPQHAEEDSAVVASALDSLYKAPLLQPEPKKEEPVVEFEDLMAVKDGAKDETVLQTKMNTVPEIQLNEATSLISDFVPPSSLEKEKKEEGSSESQDIISSLEDNEVDLNAPIATPVLKRVKPADIKTNPLISSAKQAEMANENTERIDGIDQFGTLEETTPKPSTAKKILPAVFGLILLALAYVGLVFTNILPDSFGLLGKKPAAPAQQPIVDPIPYEPSTTMPEGEFGNTEQLPLPITSVDPVIDEVKSYTLPNGSTLEATINAKHPTLIQQINWSSKQVDTDGYDNYSISANVPPNPDVKDSLRIIYRFNYNQTSKQLTPLTSDSKNILGVQ